MSTPQPIPGSSTNTSLSPAVLNIMQQLQNLPPKQRTLALTELGPQLEKEQKKTDAEVIARATTVYKEATQELTPPDWMKNGYSFVGRCRNTAQNTAQTEKLLNMWQGMKQGGWKENEEPNYKEHKEQINTFYAQVQLLEEDPEAINLSALNIYELVFSSGGRLRGPLRKRREATRGRTSQAEDSQSAAPGEC